MPFHQHQNDFGYPEQYLLKGHPIRAMYLGDTLRGFGAGLFGIFAPVYLYQLFVGALFEQPMVGVFSYYGAYWLVALVVMYNAIRIYPLLGFRKIIVLSFSMLAVHVVFLAMAETRGIIMLIPALFAGAIHSGLFWPAYHLVFARSAQAGHRGEAVGTRSALMRVSRLISPVIGGIIITKYGFSYVLAILLFMLILAAIPYSTVNMFDGHRGGLGPLLREFNQDGGASAAIAYMGNGAVLPLAAYAWPILLFLIPITYEQLGLLATLASIVTLITIYAFGKFVDHHDKLKLLRRSSIAYAGSWVLRIFSGGVWTAFTADAVANMTGSVAAIPMDSHGYDRIAREEPNEQVHLIMLREVSINIGKVITSALIIVMVLAGIDLRIILSLGIPAALLFPLVIRWGAKGQAA